jgi:hypothetical protein
MQVFPTIERLLVYAANERTVTLEQERGGDEPDVISIHVSQVDAVIRALRNAKKEVEELQ